MSKNIVIELSEVEKSFMPGKVKVHVLRGIDFKVYSTEFVILFGPSGSGKTTVLDMIAGLEPFDSGDIFVRNLEISRLNEKQLAEYRRKRIGLVFQDFNLIPNISAVDNVAMPLVFDNYGLGARQTLAKNLLSELGLSHRLNHKPFELSGGEQQRVAIARALINNPWILLIDEPTGDLDAKNAEEIMKLINHLNRHSKRTILLVTHNPDYLEYANRVLYINDGIITKTENKSQG